MGMEAPFSGARIWGANLMANSLNQTLNFATTNPKLMTAMLVRIQARKVRSLARNSVARLSSCRVTGEEFFFITKTHHTWYSLMRNSLDEYTY
jgi:hypothetical protein